MILQLLLIDIPKFKYRQDFEVGGFVSDIVGRLVNLHLDKNAMEAKDVTVQVEYAEVFSEEACRPASDLDHYEDFPSLDHYEDIPGLDYYNPLVEWATSFDTSIQTLSPDNVLELSHWVPHLPQLALHRRGSRTLIMILRMIPTVALPMEVMEDALHSLAKALSSHLHTLIFQNCSGYEVIYKRK